ncbi:MAG: DUF3419 family protein [Phycisphaeraceae bacterium]|nr:DUF3419 family protein [Phycisphaeraceae bacterium]
MTGPAPASPNAPTATGTEAAGRADFSQVRYAQCWEDADVLLEALAVRPGDTCLSIASAGDNTLSLLVHDPARVIAVDLSAAQLACLRLRIAAFQALEHHELLELIGSVDSARRPALYARCRTLLDDEARTFWDARPDDVGRGIGAAGKFEGYFRLFRRRVLPLVHGRATVESLLAPRDPAARVQFYEQTWNTWRWRLLFRIFFSRPVMGRLGRDPAFFRYVEGSVADRILARARHALVVLDPSRNPYLAWILRERHGTALPHALRPENFDAIRARVQRIEVRRCPVEACLDDPSIGWIHRFNLSDIFEYMSAGAAESILRRVVAVSPAGARLAYWNMLVPRSRPESLAADLEPLESIAEALHARDMAFFYSRFVVEERR